jgi:hypothetical protein
MQNTLQMDPQSVQCELLRCIYATSQQLGCGLCKIATSKSQINESAWSQTSNGSE